MAFNESGISEMNQKLDAIMSANKLGDRKLNDQDLARIENLKRLLDLKINPFPAEAYQVSHYATDIKQQF